MRSDPKAPLLTTEQPEWRFAFDLNLVRRAYWRMRSSDYQLLPPPEEIADTDEQWEADVMRYGEIVKFYEDRLKGN